MILKLAGQNFLFEASTNPLVRLEHLDDDMGSFGKNYRASLTDGSEIVEHQSQPELETQA